MALTSSEVAPDADAETPPDADALDNLPHGCDQAPIEMPKIQTRHAHSDQYCVDAHHVTSCCGPTGDKGAP